MPERGTGEASPCPPKPLRTQQIPGAEPAQPGATAGTGLVVVAGTWAENAGNIGGCNVARYDTMIKDFG
jgi:hypothetical protein